MKKDNYLNHYTQTKDYRFTILPSIIFNLLSTIVKQMILTNIYIYIYIYILMQM